MDKEKWEEEFDKMWKDFEIGEAYGFPEQREIIVKFIRSLLEKKEDTNG